MSKEIVKKIVSLSLMLVILTIFAGCKKGVVENKSEIQVNENEVNTGENGRGDETAEKGKIASSAEEIISPEQMDVSCWKMYRNEEYGFELRYPAKKLKLDIRSGSSGLFSLSFNPVKENMYTEATLQLGGLLNINNKALKALDS